jgi:hypothetical protein
MPKIKYCFSLSQDERSDLEAIATKGNHNSQKVMNTLILLNYKPQGFGSTGVAWSRDNLRFQTS